MKFTSPNSRPDRTHISGSSSPRARSEIIIETLSKLSQLLGAYCPDLEITLLAGGCEISSSRMCCGTFMPFEGDDDKLMLMEQLEAFEMGVEEFEQS